MNDFVLLVSKRNRGWPWPEESYGLSPMYGEEGWCRSCGIPTRAQTGPLTLQRKALTVTGAWMPYWRYDTVCLERSLAEKVAARFDITVRDVAWPKTPPGEASQLMIPVMGDAWFDPNALRAVTTAKHGTDGALCPECGIWRWLPLPIERIPRVDPQVLENGPHVMASPEWFGDGLQAFHEILFRRNLAEYLVAASPRDFEIQEIRR